MRPLPTPPNWADRLPALAKFGFVVFVGGAIYSVAQAATAVHRGDYVAATITGGLAVFSSGAVLTIAVGRLRSNTPRVVSDAAGTTFRPDPAAIWLLVIALVGAMVSSAFYVIFVPQGQVDIPFTSPGGGRRSLSLMWALLILSVGGLVALVVRRRSGYLRLAPHGIENADIVHTRNASWEDITDITDQAPKKHSYQPIVFGMRDAKPIVVNNASGYASSGAALYWMVRHYWKHPEDRDELSDGRALERLRNEQFAAE